MMHSMTAELKQQGAVEAAQDPNSNVTAEDAERKIVEETRKAGAEAYQFDPNASPEEKAAQARSHVPPGFHHERKPKAAGVATDMDDGAPDQYDLPPPSKEGALTITSTARDGGDTGENGHILEDENARWVERTGWAPRFGSGSTAESEGENLLDHQTWVESKLDDKFFGDWYHNTGIIIFACLASWFVATLGGGLGWIFIIMAVCGTYYRTSIRRVRRNFRDDIRREMAKTQLETDVESLEWINDFLVKFWPIFQPVFSDTVIKTVDQILSASTPNFLDSLRLKTFILGTKPPRLEHVKTYPKAEDDIVLMDWKFSFNPNDTADLTARQIKNKVNPKIVLEVRIGKAMVSKGLDVIVEDMAFSGLIRVKVKLQIAFPHVERIEICFLEEPTIDYVCKPLGGDTFGFDINFIPGLQSFIQSMIHATLGPMMYAPNVFPVEVAKMLSGNPIDQAIGVLAVTLHGAQGLRNPDKFSGTPDPYVIVSLNNRLELARTKIINENANPRWNETKYIIITSLKDVLTLQVFDFNDIRKDKELGTASFDLAVLEDESQQENLQLEVLANGKARGQIQADIQFFPVLEGRKLEDGTQEPPPESNTGIARFTVEQVKDLDGTRSLVGQLSPYAVLLLNGKEVHVTQKLKKTNNPIWSNGSKELLITDRKTARLGLVVKDDRGLAADLILGTYQIKLNDMLDLMEKGQEWHYLSGAKNARAKLTLQWKPVALKGGLGGSGGYVTPIGVMRLHFLNARELRNVETVGKSDPYVRVMQSGIEKARTVTFRANLNPDWDEVLYVPVHSTRERLVLEVMDEENLGKDRSLGQVELNARDYVKESEDGEYLEHSERRTQSDQLRTHGKGSPKGVLNYTVAFYPTLDVADPEEEDEEKQTQTDTQAAPGDNAANPNAVNGQSEERTSAMEVVSSLADNLLGGDKEQNGTTDEKKLPKVPKLRLGPEDLVKYLSGIIVFRLIDGDFTHSNRRVEVTIDDMRFPSYVSSKAKSRQTRFDETGDTFVRELDVSRITVRLRAKSDNKSDEADENVVAKLTSDTLSTLKQCLNRPTVLTLRDSEGGINKITVSLKYIPVKMKLDPSESINNMGSLRVDVLDATDLPSADRNGLSDPFCKFVLNGKEVYKTKEQRKTLNPTWRENFEVLVSSRIAADFRVKVYDWDQFGNDDHLGEAGVDLRALDPLTPQEYRLRLDGKSGTVRLRLLFRPDYVTRERQGSSTFSGTFATPSKIVTGVAGAPIKGVGMVGGGVAKGASFLKQGFRGKKKGEMIDSTTEAEESPNSDNAVPAREASRMDGSPQPPQTPTMVQQHHRSASFGGRSAMSAAGVQRSSAETGTASFTVLSGFGFPTDGNVRVVVKQMTAKGAKEVWKTKATKSSSGRFEWMEPFKVVCAADTQFQLQVMTHSLFHDSPLGDAYLFVNDSSAPFDKEIPIGSGSVVMRTSFTPLSGESPKANGTTTRKSFLTKSPKESRSRGVTPS